MSGVLIHDGRRIGHRKWCVDAISGGSADGVVLNPFATPRVAEPRHPSASDLAQAVRGANGEVVFDAMTHALFLPGTNKRDFYDAWELWGPTGANLDGAAHQLAHVERVFDRQSQVGAPHLAPTLQLQSPQSPNAYVARDLARVARGLDKDCWQSLVGTRSFWASGPHLDAYVGSLAALRAPVWVITVANELVVDQRPRSHGHGRFRWPVPNRALALAAVPRDRRVWGLRWPPGGRCGGRHCRQRLGPCPADVRPARLSRRLGPGHQDPRVVCDPGRAELGPASGHRGSHRALGRRRVPARSVGGPMPPSDQAQRMHHLRELRSAVQQIVAPGSRQARVDELRNRYRAAVSDYDSLIGDLRPVVREVDKTAWASNPARALEAYAGSEGL